MLVQNTISVGAVRPIGPLTEAMLDPGDIVRTTATMRHREKDLIYAQGDAAGELYIVDYGCVRTSQVTPEGRRMVTGFYFAGDVFGFEVGAERHYCAEALSDAGTRRFRLGLKEMAHPAVADMLLHHLDRIQQHLLILGTQNSIERVAAFLVALADAQGERTQVKLPMSRCDIAEYLGLKLETVSRALHRLQDMGLVDLNSARSIVLRSRRELIALGA